MQTSEHLHQHDQAHPHDHAPENLQLWLKTLLLLGLGLYFTHNILSGNLMNYINARFAWLSCVAAALFLLLGLVSSYDRFRARTHHHHSHTPSWPMLIVVAVPLVLGTLIPSRPLGANAAEGNLSPGMVSTDNAAAFTTDPLEWNVLDWLRTFNNSDDLTAFNGQQVEVTGFVYRTDAFAENQFMVARFVISCCVADASAIGLPVVWDQLTDLLDEGTSAEDTWVRVQGTFELGNFGGNVLPIVHPDAIEVIAQPDHPYLYP